MIHLVVSPSNTATVHLYVNDRRKKPEVFAQEYVRSPEVAILESQMFADAAQRELEKLVRKLLKKAGFKLVKAGKRGE
jgi:hypothetical protein